MLDVTEMVCWAAGGPQQYTGRSMGDSHQHLLITAAEWDAFLDDFQQTLDKFGVPQPEQARRLSPAPEQTLSSEMGESFKVITLGRKRGCASHNGGPHGPQHDPEGRRLPIKLDTTTNGEFAPIPLEPVHHQARRLASDLATENAKRRGVSCRSFSSRPAARLRPCWR